MQVQPNAGLLLLVWLSKHLCWISSPFPPLFPPPVHVWLWMSGQVIQRFFNELYLFLFVDVIIVVLSVYSDDSIHIYKYIATYIF